MCVVITRDSDNHQRAARALISAEEEAAVHWKDDVIDVIEWNEVAPIASVVGAKVANNPRFRLWVIPNTRAARMEYLTVGTETARKAWASIGAETVRTLSTAQQRNYADRDPVTLTEVELDLGLHTRETRVKVDPPPSRPPAR